MDPQSPLSFVEDLPPAGRLISKNRLRLAWLIAVLADGIQLGGFTVFSEGFLSPINDVLDLVVSVALIYLLGWHLAFLPSIVLKFMPVADLAPTWSLAVFLATRSRRTETDKPAPPMLSA